LYGDWSKAAINTIDAAVGRTTNGDASKQQEPADAAS
jgi:hypothetical protein